MVTRRVPALLILAVLVPWGAALFGGIVASELRRVVPALAPHFRMTSWSECLDHLASWYGSTEAACVAANVVLYQRTARGWPKNIDMARVLSADERASVTGEKTLADSTMDNGATTTQICLLARAFSATRGEMRRTAAMAGLRYLLEAQYPNGGWPQGLPLEADYPRYLTFDDGVMVRALQLMRDVSGGVQDFSFVGVGTKGRARRAFERRLSS